MIEYLYIDKARLDSYFNQIASPVHYDKIPVWKVAFGLTGPKVESTQSRQGRGVTLEEKAKRFEEHIVSNHLVLKGRDQMIVGNNPAPFVIEELDAQRLFIRRKNQHLNLWLVCEPINATNAEDEEENLLLLIEDYRADDDHPHTRPSSGTIFQMLDQELRNTNDHDFLQQLDEHDFQINPLETLEKAGAEVGPVRRIRVIYRLRAKIYDKNAKPPVRGVVGYPIVITEA